ncbi:hypothetical protein QO004_000957 [Rhizobium mesoamericanum]|uniref:hypothetical protein n=1 Tax=Rhizobium mesoamericanum TaxID=1079800 RepID=UPI00278987A4|nr:hypothetical protein [Rhizobium mesoamericanum]MDQ0559179.1 hypothetical protein [Rhizobium mesoamericanum]
MADSDNSRTLPTVTQADLHSFVVASFPTHPEVAARLTAPLDTRNDDLAFTIWRQWCAARHRLIESCLWQQGLEERLFAMVGTPSGAPEAWKAADQQIGYSEAVQEEERAAAMEDDVAEMLWDTPAESIVGAIAKLHAMLTKWQPAALSDEYPWPQLRSVIADLLKIDAEISSRGTARRQVTAMLRALHNV